MPPLDRIDEAVRAHLVCPPPKSTSTARSGATCFTAAQESGALRGDLDVNVSRLLLLGAMNWATEWWDPKRRTLDELVRATPLLVRHGMGAHDLHT